MQPRFAALAWTTAAMICLGIPALGQDGPADTGDAMRKWKDSMTPGAPHKALSFMAGSWETTTRVWMDGPTASPAETRGTADINWIVEGASSSSG